MAKFYGILLIIILIGVSGVIAYVGDIVGRRMGRKRLSLFGMRPRHTAIAISVVSGMLITMFTLAAAMLVSQDVRSGLLRVVEMRKEKKVLEREVQVRKHNMEIATRELQAAQQKVTEVQSQLETTRGDLAKAQIEFKERQEAAQRKVAEVQSRLRRTRRDLAKAQLEFKERQEAAQQKVAEVQSQLKTTRGDLTKAQTELKELQIKLATAKTLLEKAETDYQSASEAAFEMGREYLKLEDEITKAAGVHAVERATPVLVGAGQPLDAELVSGGQPKSVIRTQLDHFIGRLNDKARAAGVHSASEATEVVKIRKAAYDAEKKTARWYNRDQVLEAICDEIHAAKDGVIVRAYSMLNVYAGEPLFIDFKLFNNRLVFRKGEMLAQALLDGRESQPALLGKLVGLLKEVGTQARAKNLMPRANSTAADPFGSSASAVGEMSYEELFDKIEEIRAVNGPAVVTVFAAEEAWTMGPLQVGMRVENRELKVESRE